MCPQHRSRLTLVLQKPQLNLPLIIDSQLLLKFDNASNIDSVFRGA